MELKFIIIVPTTLVVVACLEHTMNRYNNTDKSTVFSYTPVCIFHHHLSFISEQYCTRSQSVHKKCIIHVQHATLDNGGSQYI